MKIRLLFFILFLSFNTFAQDPQFSQYYSAPLILNPAMTGNTECYRAGLNARTQWTSLPGGAFNTASFFMDMNYEDYNSGFGLLFLHDQIGTPRLTSNQVSGFYSYLVPVSKMINFRFGLEGSVVNRSLDYTRLVFEDQFSGINVTNPKTVDPVSGYSRVNYLDLSSGVLLFGEDKYWIGFSAHHLNRAEQSFYIAPSRLPVKYSIHGGINFYIKNHPKQQDDESIRIIPTFIYKAQDRFDQLDIGMYFLRAPLLLGAWYRGIPVKKDMNIVNTDAIILQAGFQLNSFSFTYSFDYTVSKLNIGNTHGSHEISLIYLFCLEWPKKRKPPKHVRRLPCPDFQKSIRYKGKGNGF